MDDSKPKSKIAKVEGEVAIPFTSKAEPTKIKGKAGRPRKIKTAGPGKITAILEKQVQATLELKGILSDDEIKAELKLLLIECVRILRQHASTLDVANVEYIKTPNGQKKIHVGGYPVEDINAIFTIFNGIKQLVMPETQLPDTKKDIMSLIKNGYKAPFPD